MRKLSTSVYFRFVLFQDEDQDAAVVRQSVFGEVPEEIVNLLISSGFVYRRNVISNVGC